jgi:hypothetical protein
MSLNKGIATRIKTTNNSVFTCEKIDSKCRAALFSE